MDGIFFSFSLVSFSLRPSAKHNLKYLVSVRKWIALETEKKCHWAFCASYTDSSRRQKKISLNFGSLPSLIYYRMDCKGYSEGMRIVFLSSFSNEPFQAHFENGDSFTWFNWPHFLLTSPKIERKKNMYLYM